MSDLMITKSYSNNPFVDILLYYTKILAFGSIVKDEDEAERNETEESILAGDIYVSCVEKNVIFEMFHYDRELLTSVGITDNALINRCINNINYIPKDKRKELTELARLKYIDKYEELNNYYRKLCGLPKLGEYGIPIKDYEYEFDGGVNPWNVTYVHELDHEAVLYLKQRGILDIMRIDYPDADYLDYITCGIDPYKLRKAYSFQLVYYPDADKGVIQEKFISKYNENRLFVISTFYSEGLKITSDYYNNFIGFIIMIMTITDMLVETNEHIIKRDILDKRCIQYIFEMYGIPYYNSIPLRYQYRMCKNINQLIKYKSCPQGMLNLIDLFGAENVEVFKYFILRDRNVDKWGELVYNTTTKTIGKFNDLIIHDQVIVPGNDNLSTQLNGNTINIDFPFNNYLSSSNNKIYVWGNDKLLVRNTDYTLSQNKIDLTDYTLYNKIRVDFYYNRNAVPNVTDIVIDKDHAFYVYSNEILTKEKTFKFTVPYSNYLLESNDIMVVMDGKYLIQPNEYTVDISTKEITLKNSFSGTKKVTVYCPYNNGKYLDTRFKRVSIKATSNGQTEFELKYTTNSNSTVPFKDYVQNGNAFFVTYQNRFLVEGVDYTVNTSTGKIILTNITVPVNKEIVVHYLYSTSSISQDVEILKKEVILIATEKFQTVFPLVDDEGNSVLPFEGYNKTAYKAYVAIKGNSRYLDEDYYDLYSKNLVLRDTSLYIRPGDEIKILFVYGPHETMNSLEITRSFSMSTEHFQRNINISLPEPNFLSTLKGKVIVDVYGNYLDDDDYTINESTSTLNITNPDKLPAANQKINLLFIRANIKENGIKIKQSKLTVSSNNQTKFNITNPFIGFNELITDKKYQQNTILLINNIPVNNDNISIVKTSSGTYQIVLENTPVKTTDTLILLQLYNRWYINNSITSVKEFKATVNTEATVNDDLNAEIPFPFEKYLENGWYMFVTDPSGNILYRSENDVGPQSEVSVNKMDVIGNYLTFLNVNDILEYNRLVYNFIYYNDNYTDEVEEEDYENNYNLKFIHTPLSDDYFSGYIMKQTNTLPYDTVTSDDVFWDGVAYEYDRGASHERVKSEILRKKFNYERTKYFSLHYIIDIAEMTFQIAYFYNMLYDDVFIEDNLKIKVPVIAAYREFNIAHLFVYMTALTYLYMAEKPGEKISSSIMDTTSKVLYIKGFNFKSDLETLRKWIIKNRRYIKDFPAIQKVNENNEPLYIDAQTGEVTTNAKSENRTPNEPIWNFVNRTTLDQFGFDDGTGQIKDINSFVDIFIHNKSIYNLVVHSMYDAPDYDIYSIWRTLYGSLMVYRNNMKFFHITDENGNERMASTLDEFLKYKDSELYRDLQYIENISDIQTRKEFIIDRIADIVYLLEEYFDKDNFGYIFDQFPGVSGHSLLDYIYTMINFFKSYKIVLRSKGDYITFNSDDPSLNSIKYFDIKDTHVFTEKYEYFTPVEYTTPGVYTSKNENIFFEDKKKFIEKYTAGVDSKYDAVVKEYNMKTTTICYILLKRTTGQIITIYLTDGRTFTTDQGMGFLASRDVNTGEFVETITFFYPYINSEDTVVPYMGFNFKDLDNAAAQFITMDHDNIPENDSKFTSKNSNTVFPHTLKAPDEAENEFIIIEVERGTEFYAYVTPDPGYTAGMLNYRYGIVFDDPVVVSATDATTKMEEVKIYQSQHQKISIFDLDPFGMPHNIYTKSVQVPYNSQWYYDIEADEGYIEGQLEITPDPGELSYITVTSQTVINATPAEIIRYNVTITAPLHETIYATIGDDNYIVNGGNVEYIQSVEYWTEYNVSIQSDEGYNPGALTVPVHGAITKDVVNNAGVFNITARPATIKRFKVTLDQSPNQNIIIYYNDNVFNGNSYIEVDIGTMITVRLNAMAHYRSGALVIRGATVDSDDLIEANIKVENDIIITATPATYMETVSITIDSGANQTISVFCDTNNDGVEEEYTTSFTAPYGCSYHSTITPDPGYVSIDAMYITNGSSLNLIKDVTVSAPDAIPQ